MTKATAPLSPRQVIGNRRRALSIEEASAALVALLSGAGRVPPRHVLQRMTTAALERQEAAQLRARALAARKREADALGHEFAAAINVWTGLPVKARSGRITARISGLQQRIASLQKTEAANV